MNGMKIVIPGDPEAQARMRSYFRGGKIHCYDPDKKEKDYLKAFLQEYISENYPNYQFPNNPKVSFYFYCSIPKGMPKRLKWYAERGMLRKRTRPDADNYIKLYFDCMNEIILEDDSQASIGEAAKFFHKEPKTVIFIDEADEILNMPLDEIANFSESCEWIREKMASQRGYISHPYEGIPLYPSNIPPAVTIFPS